MFSWFSKIRPAFLGGILIIGLSICQTTAVAASQLTVDEVRETFIGREWGQGRHTFLFTKDGVFKYSSTKGVAFGGTYVMDDKGTVCATNEDTSPHPGRRTCFTFYRKGDGYEYYHDRSGKYWPAELK
jgi:hypothetical protein